MRVAISGVASAALMVSCLLATAASSAAPATKVKSGEWLTHGRDDSEQRYSPLKQVNADTVSKLGLAWYADLTERGQYQSTPVVVDGRLYVTTPWSKIYAFDAQSGKQLWKYDPKVPRELAATSLCCNNSNRGVAYSDGKVIIGTLDGRLIAVDAKKGTLAWETQTTNPQDAMSITGAPRVGNGIVFIGQAGAEFHQRGFMSAYDLKTGKQRWKFYLVPGDPAKGADGAASDPVMAMAAKSWKGEWWKTGGGGTPWDGIAYDPELNLIYVGTGNGSPWNAQHRSPGGGDNLYLSSIVALNADTGKYVWHYQTSPGDNWDFNAAQPMILADLRIGNAVRKVIMQAPKNGFFYVLDRADGKLISGDAFAFTSWATGIDMKTGRPIETESARYRYTPVRLSPSPVGAHHWPPMAYNPATGLVYYPGQETSMVAAMEEKFEYKEGQWNLGMRMGTRPGADGKASENVPIDPKAPPAGGFFVAWNPIMKKAEWKIPFQSSGGALSTAGQLIFVGNSTGKLFALDPASGKTLWESQMASGGVATPVSYELDGKQYIAVMAGISKGKIFSFALP